MAIVIESPKLIAIRVTKLTPLSNKNNFVYTYNAILDVTAQLHSGTTGYNASQYDGRDINVGDYVATTSQGRVLKVSELISVGPTRIECILVDEDQVNAAVDSTQYGESSIDTDDGILFELREGKPYLFPLPDILPGGLTEEFAIQIATRFNFVGKEKNVNIELVTHSFEVGETVALGAGGWTTNTSAPTGVVVKTDDDSFSVRLFGTKTYMELPGAIGDIYFWDPVDRMLTTTPTSPASLRLFQKLASKEALLLDAVAPAQGSGSDFSGNYNDLFNKPVIPSDISHLADASGILIHVTKTSDLTNDSNFASQAYVDTQIANVSGGGGIDLSGYATTTDLSNATTTLGNADAQTLIDAKAYADTVSFSGAYGDLTGAPSIPDVTGLASTAYVDAQIASIGGHFSGNYTDLTNKPTIPSIDGLASTAYVDAQVGAIETFSRNYNDLTNKPSLFNGDYTTLFNKPAIPGNTSDLINDAGFLTSITQAQVFTALGFTPQNAATAFSGDYNSLINKPSIPSIAGLATETFVTTALAGIDGLFSGDYNDLTNKPSIPSIAGLASTAYVDQQIANVASGGSIDLSSYVTDAELATELAGYQTTVDLSVYATTAALDSAIEAISIPDVSNFITLADIPTIPSIDGLASTAYVDAKIASVPAIPADVSELTDTTNLLDHFSGSYTDLTDKPTIPSIAGFATTAYVDTQIASVSGGGVDLSGYATTSFVNNLLNGFNLEDLADTYVTGVSNGMALVWSSANNRWQPGVVSGGSVDLTGYATEEWVNNALLNVGAGISEISQLNDVAINGTETNTHALMFNSQSGMWENVDLTENWATKDYVTEQLVAFSTDGTIDLEGYASEIWVDQRILERGPHFSGDYNALTNLPSLFSGDYTDLTNTPENQLDNLTFALVGSNLQLSNGATIDLSSLPVSYTTLTNKPNLFSGSYTDLNNKPTLFSGNYLDLSNKPYIPSIAGLASEDYVNNLHNDPDITGDRNFTHDVEFRGTTNIVASTVDTAAEHKNFVMALQTTDDTVTEAVFSDSSRIVIAPNSTAMFEVYIVGATAADQYGVKLKGIINNTLGAVTMIGDPSRETLAQTDLSWTANVEVDDTNKSLKITVVGSAGTTIDWTVFCEINAVKR